MNFPFIKSRLRRAIERGIANGSLQDEIRELGDLAIKSRGDAEDICWGLQKLDGDTKELGRQARALASLFQEVESRDCAAFDILQERGIPNLIRLYDEICHAAEEEDTDELMFILKIFGLYGTVTGTLKIVEAARKPLKPDGYMWSVILRGFTAGHPEKDLLYNSLRDPLPGGFIAVSLLDAVNAVLIEGEPMQHPFDTVEGRQRLRSWLASQDPDEFSYAHSATAALPFVGSPERDELLVLALKHPDSGVQVEAAWAAAKLGREEGFQELARHCLNFNTAETAKRYLQELGREDVVPSESNAPGFAALAEFARWLAHPNELGRAPDKLEIVDHRELRWPPERELKPFWLIRYTAHDTTGLEEDDIECGLVGSRTFCFFSYKLSERPPEDAYAVHCYWEMESEGIEELDVGDAPGEYASLLTQWNGAPLENPRMRYVAEVSPDLGHPQRLVGLASATLNGEPGWVALDGSRSEWYPQSEQPEDALESVVLKVHVGRQLLGFTDKPDRKKFLSPPRPPRPPEQIIHAYEELLAEAQKAEGRKRKDAFGSFGAIGDHFGQYVDVLVQLGRAGEVRRLVAELAPEWDHPLGYGKLGRAAFKSGHQDVAESFFVKYREKCQNFERGEEMGLLAEIWCQAGKAEEASALLIECLRRILEGSKTATGSDVQCFEDWFQAQRKSFLKLFPEGTATLADQSIPETTLRQN